MDPTDPQPTCLNCGAVLLDWQCSACGTCNCGRCEACIGPADTLTPGEKNFGDQIGG